MDDLEEAAGVGGEADLVDGRACVLCIRSLTRQTPSLPWLDLVCTPREHHHSLSSSSSSSSSSASSLLKLQVLLCYLLFILLGSPESPPIVAVARRHWCTLSGKWLWAEVRPTGEEEEKATA
ncbi:hypothetical protein MRB53_023921 [Persea americana]|uniref:Uncharacterized protein n=1 Tax=Persea americana TaxID=3435 RepID=A0ACC2LBY0_PERAE|nr:hypothetical protein MRB53_023921 [Persea americana]